MSCNRCGKCCINPIIALHNVPIANDKQEMTRWLQGHGINVMKLYNGKEEVLAVQFNSICQHLEYVDGKTRCKIYENRPQICKDYMCKQIIESEILELVTKE